MKRKNLALGAHSVSFLAVFVLLFLLGTFGQTQAQAQQPVKLIVVTSTVGTSGFDTASALARVVQKYHPHIELFVQPTATGAVRHRMAAENKAHIVYEAVQGLSDLYANKGSFKDSPLAWRSLYGFTSAAACVFLVTKRSRNDIKSMSDLTGKSVSLLTDTMREVATLVLTELKLFDKIRPKVIAFASMPDALETGTVDATVTYMSSMGLALASSVREMLTRTQIKPLILTEKEKKIIASIPGLAVDDIPADILKKEQPGFPAATIPCWLLPFGYHFSPDVSVDHAYAITKTIFEHGDEAAKLTPSGFQLLATLDKAKRIGALGLDSIQKVCPVHPGAAKYYKEIGLWNNRYTEGKVTPRSK